MATATVQVEEVEGFAGRARCFKIDPPYQGHSYVTVCLTEGYRKVVLPKAEVFPANETGACVERTLASRPGSFVLHDVPNTPETISGAYWLALLLLGGYEIQPQDAA